MLSFRRANTDLAGQDHYLHRLQLKFKLRHRQTFQQNLIFSLTVFALPLSLQYLMISKNWRMFLGSVCYRSFS